MNEAGRWMTALIVALPMLAAAAVALRRSIGLERGSFGIVRGGCLAAGLVAFGGLVRSVWFDPGMSSDVASGWTWMPSIGDAVPGVEVALRADWASLFLAMIGAVTIGLGTPSARGAPRAAASDTARAGLLASSVLLAVLCDNLLIAWIGWMTSGLCLAATRASSLSAAGEDDVRRVSQSAALELAADTLGLAGIVMLGIRLGSLKEGALFGSGGDQSSLLHEFLSSSLASDVLKAHQNSVVVSGTGILIAVLMRVRAFPFLFAARETAHEEAADRPLAAAAAVVTAGVMLWTFREMLSSVPVLQNLTMTLGALTLVGASWSAIAAVSVLTRATLVTAAAFGLLLVGVAMPSPHVTSAVFRWTACCAGVAGLLPALSVRERGGLCRLAAIVILLAGGSGQREILARVATNAVSPAAPPARFGSWLLMGSLVVGQIVFGLACVRWMQRASDEANREPSAGWMWMATCWLLTLGGLTVAPEIMPESWLSAVSKASGIPFAASAATLPWLATVWPGVLGAVLGLIFAENRRRAGGRLVRVGREFFLVESLLLRPATEAVRAIAVATAWAARTVFPWCLALFVNGGARVAEELHAELEAGTESLALLAAIFGAAILALSV